MPTPDRPGPEGQGQWNVSDPDWKLCLIRLGVRGEPSGTGEGPRGSGSAGGIMAHLSSEGVAPVSTDPTLAGQWTTASVVSWRPSGGPDP